MEQLRANGTPVFLATQQEAHRVAYLEQRVFKDMFDGMFVTSMIGHEKHELAFWTAVLEQLKADYPDLKPSQIAYFDDRQSLVELARIFRINAHVYHDAPQVASILLSQ